MDITMEKVMSSLVRNNMKPYFAETKNEVTPLISKLLHDGDSVAVGGSMSLFECGAIEHLRCGRYHFYDRYEHGLTDEDIRNIYLKSMDADAYFCSCNAVTESGELYNVDGNSNRICAISYGPKSVIMVVGKNKIVTDLSGAINRVKTITAPQICKKRRRNTYCKEKGSCISISDGLSDMTSGCESPDRTCCNYLVSGKQRIKDRIKVILVGESMGY